MNLNLAAALAALCGLACGDRQHAAHAAIAARPPRLARAADPIVSDSLVRALVVNGIRWRLDSTMTLASAQTTLGESPVHKPGGHDEPDWICYTISLPSDSLYLLLRSDGMGGEQDWLGALNSRNRRLRRSLPGNARVRGACDPSAPTTAFSLACR